MTPRSTAFVGVAIVAAIVAAIALAPALLRPTSSSDGTGSNPETTAIEVPAWKPGDRWTYNASWRSADEVSRAFHAELTKSIVGTVTTLSGPAYNVTLEGTASSDGGVSPLKELGDASAKLTGFAWYRTADLAVVRAERTVELATELTIHNRSFRVVYEATLRVLLDPPLAVWAFPLDANATWNATSNATVYFRSALRAEMPNATFETSHVVTFTVPIGLSMRAGLFEDVTVPAGRFPALGVSVSSEPMTVELDDRLASVAWNLTSDPVEFPGHGVAKLWFSEGVGNIVRAITPADRDRGLHLEMVLTSFSRA